MSLEPRMHAHLNSLLESFYVHPLADFHNNLLKSINVDPLAEISNRLVESVCANPLIGIHSSLLKSINAGSLAGLQNGLLESINEENYRFIKQLSGSLRSISESIYRDVFTFQSRLLDLALEEKQGGLLIKEGWIPHHTMPLEEMVERYWLNEEAEWDFGANDYLETHYKEHWVEARGALEKNLEENEIVDLDSKEVFTEAMDNFEDGRFTSVTRVLIPEIERVTRGLGHSQLGQAMRELTDDAPINVLSSWFEWAIHGYLTETKMGELGLVSKVDLNAPVSDEIPNRHAVAHGTSYSNRRIALNSLFIVDHVFCIVGERYELLDESDD